MLLWAKSPRLDVVTRRPAGKDWRSRCRTQSCSRYWSTSRARLPSRKVLLGGSTLIPWLCSPLRYSDLSPERRYSIQFLFTIVQNPFVTRLILSRDTEFVNNFNVRFSVSIGQVIFPRRCPKHWCIFPQRST